ncbi:MAG: hypothetical protein JWN96_2806 [Mycobacterium sp.]|jgi:hypothetical protein|nr:hypothetical protein [Mycobacterium sp.]
MGRTDGLILAADTCIAVGTVSEDAGEVAVTVTTSPVDETEFFLVAEHSLRLDGCDLPVSTLLDTWLCAKVMAVSQHR